MEPKQDFYNSCVCRTARGGKRQVSDNELLVARIGLRQARNRLMSLTEIERRLSRQAGLRLTKVLVDGVETYEDFEALDRAREIASLTGHVIPNYLSIPMGRRSDLPEDIYLPIARALLASEEMIGSRIG